MRKSCRVRSSEMGAGWSNMMFVDGDRYFYSSDPASQTYDPSKEGVRNGGWIVGLFADERKQAGYIIILKENR